MINLSCMLELCWFVYCVVEGALLARKHKFPMLYGAALGALFAISSYLLLLICLDLIAKIRNRISRK